MARTFTRIVLSVNSAAIAASCCLSLASCPSVHSRMERKPGLDFSSEIAKDMALAISVAPLGTIFVIASCKTR